MDHREKLLFSLIAVLGGACATPEEESSPQPAPQNGPNLQERAQTVTAEQLEARAKLAASKRYAAPLSGEVSISTAETMLAALDIPADFNPRVITLVSPHEEAAFDVPQWGAIRPQKGNSLMVLSTGQSNHPTLLSEPGVDFGGGGPVGDTATFTIAVDIPEGVNRFSFDYNFLSAEYPDFIGSAFNDTFTVTITDANGTRSALSSPVTVNSTVFQPASDSLVGTARFPFRLYVDNALGVDTLFDTGVIQDAGITGFQRVVVEVADGGTATIQFDIRDLGDGLLDSAVILDNLSFVTVAAIDPAPITTNANDPSLGLIDAQSTHVTTDPARLTGAGRPVNAVVADGASQIILRSSVPGPGTARFELAEGLERGKLAAISGAAPDWRDSVDVPSVLHEGKYYAFALYQSPANFLRPGVAADHDVERRSVDLSMTHLPGEQGELRGDFTVEVIRRPVVLVHNAWSDCTAWEGGTFWRASLQMQTPIGLPSFLKIKCVRNYRPNKGLDESGNLTVIPTAINEALNELRASSVAATQVDLIAHGIGGLQARRYLERDDYKNQLNFHDGDVDRFITINTPHLGSRMACEATNYRDFAKLNGIWNLAVPGNPLGLKGSLENAKVFIDNTDGDIILDEIRLDSTVIGSLRQTSVPSHAMFSSGGLTIPASLPLPPPPVGVGALVPATSILRNDGGGNLVPLYTQMMKESRRTKHLLGNTSAQHRSLYSVNSLFFCAEGNCTADDQHDFFVKVSEQKGRLDTANTTISTVTAGDISSGHPRIQIHDTTSSELRELLNAPFGPNDKFADGFPAPGLGVCPPVIAGTPPPPPVNPLMTKEKPNFGISAITSDLTIISPAPGTIVTPGTSIPVVVQGLNGFQPELTMVVGNGEAATGDDPVNNTLLLPISTNAIGTIQIAAMAFGTNGDIAFSQAVPLNVSVGATLNAIEIQGGDVVMRRPGATTRLTVLGIYSDGIKRDLTAGQGTEYGVSNAGAQPFASVTNTGQVTALRSGSLTISARNGNRFTSVSVKVGFPACGDGVLDPGEECDDGNIVGGDACTATCELVNGLPDAVCSSPTVCTDPGLCSANVTTLGAGSTDPNNDPLTITQTPAGPYGVGDHNVTVRVSDGQSTDSCVSSLDVNDCELPQLACAGDFSVECTGAGGATITPPGATASDNCGVDVDAPAAGHRNLGQHALAYTATDPSGNQATCSTQVTVADTTSPVITCPAPSVAECTGNGRAQVNPGNGSATDVCTVAQVTGPGAGSFPVGVTPLTYTATDLSGNQATCSTQVTVRDTQLPSITCPAARVAECTGNGRATVDPGDATANDTCALASLTDPGPTSFPLGANTVTYTATDLGGNQATCSTQVTVRDTAGPTVTAAGATPLWPVDSNYRTVSLADCGITVTDRCSGAVPPAIHQAQITCVTSDEPDNAAGPDDGDTANDIVIVNANTVRLRAEHAQSGDGRFYSIYFRVVDAAGNITRSMCPVRVVPQGCPAPTGGVTINQPGDCHADDSGGKFSVCR